MPYISEERRQQLIGVGARELPNHPGELNFLVTRVVLEYLGEKPNYERFNAAVGALECAKMELYRRMVVPYEDTKIAENGDVYPTLPSGQGSIPRTTQDAVRRRNIYDAGAHRPGSPEKDLA